MVLYLLQHELLWVGHVGSRRMDQKLRLLVSLESDGPEVHHCAIMMENLKFPFDILDYIFSLLQPHPKSLIACSKALPLVSHIIERHRYRHIIIHTGISDFTHSFEPSHLLKLLSESPGIVNHVHVLQLEFHENYLKCPGRMAPYLEQITSILPMFTALKCIMLHSQYSTFSWEGYFPLSFRTAVEGCLHLPTLQEVQIANLLFPLSLLHDHTHITRFSVFGASKIPESLDTPYPQLESLSGRDFTEYIVTFASWAKQHILKLRSLAYDYSSNHTILELLEICSNTLNNLDLHLTRHVSSGELPISYGTYFIPKYRRFL
jgi:hypothetical protein